VRVEQVWRTATGA